MSSGIRSVGMALLLLFGVGRGTALDTTNLPANTWVPIQPTLEQPANKEEQGAWNAAGWNKLVYDSKHSRCLFYDRWYDKKHGGYTIYGNCLFSFDVLTGRLSPVKISNWFRKEDEHYNTYALPENERDPTPCDRHVYCAFEYVPENNSVYICNGANQAAKTPTLNGHDVVHDTWRFDLARKVWAKVPSKETPPNKLEDGMAYCPETQSMVYAGHGRIWLMDLASGEWRPAREHLPRVHMGMAVVYDPPRKRMLLVGGGAYDKWKTKEGGFNAVYAFDPATEKVSKLADCPTAFCRAGLAYHSRADLFFAVVNLEGKSDEQPSGLFCYDPKKDVWSTVEYKGERPGKYQWIQMCYDSKNDLLVAMDGEQTHFKVFRYAVAKPGAGK